MEPDARIAEPGIGADPADAQFRLLVETVSDCAIFLLDPEGRVMSWNAGAQRIKGYLAAEILGRHFSAFYAPEDRATGKPQELLRRAAREGRTRDEGWRLRKDGSRFWADVVITALRDSSGRVTGYAKVTRDRTEQRSSHGEVVRDQALSRRLVEAEEAERRRIAGELHDRVGQNLSALNINLDIVLGALGEEAPMDVRVRLRDSLALVDGTLQSIENVMADLRPPLLEEYGLGAALGWYAEEFCKRTGIDIDFQDEAREKNRGLRSDAAVALFRIAQEALNNVAKHANARRVRITVSASGEEMAVEVGDDGAGFDPLAAEARASRWGMTTMRERAEAVGGRVEITSAPGSGTVLRATVPF